MYYRLQPDCRLVKGAARGAIYDLRSGKVYSVNGGAVSLLEVCQDTPLEELADMRAPQDEKRIQFLQKLTDLGLGSFSFLPGSVRNDSQPLPEPRLEFIWLELTSACNNRCLHCYAGSGPEQHRSPVSHERWLELIKEARQAGAEGIQLIGGEPLMYPKWQDLVREAREEGYALIEIFTNATLIDDECVQFFKTNNVNIATTIYADNAAIHDQVTQNPGSFDKTLRAVQKLLDAKIPLRIASIIMKTNEEEVDKIMALCAKLGVEVNPPDVIRPTGRGSDETLMPVAYQRPSIRPPFAVDRDTFEKSQSVHACLAGKAAITATGDVIPCIFARDRVCGNILNRSLLEILSEQPLQTCWHTTKDCLEKCKDCEYRYACTDCRPLAQAICPEKGWLSCTAGCSYNPYLGKWEDDCSCQTNTPVTIGKNPK